MTLRDPPSPTRPEIAALATREAQRQAESIRLIASENYASRAVLEATATVLGNKYSEGYPHKRYYEGQQQIDAVEELARSRVGALFGAEHVNVQPYSGSPANLAVYLAFAKPGETIMGLGLPAGGHLTHGWSVSISGKFWKSVPYGVRESDHRIDLDQVRSLAKESKRSSSGAAHRLPAHHRLPGVPRHCDEVGRCWWRTSRTSPAWSPAARIPRRSASPTW